jgi:integrase
MSGAISSFRGAFFVLWYDPATKRTRKVYRYRGLKMYDRRIAQKLLVEMQTDTENGTFYIEKYLQQNFSDVLPFINDWIAGVDDLAPATAKGYRSYVNNHIRPFFEALPGVALHDIQIDVLRRFRRGLKAKGLSPKMQSNIMYCLRVILIAAWEARRIPAMPPFPHKKEYQLEKRPIQWLPEIRQMAVIEKIPVEHQPIFWFLKYHLRRPGEACAMFRNDYRDGVFTVCRSLSARKLVGKTKTGEIHTIPCHPDMVPWLEVERAKQVKEGILSPYLFVNPQARRDGKRYTNEALNILWKAACKEAGEDIDLYSGLKHSSCSQYINEKGVSESELQVITDHARIESVRSYARTEVSRKLEIMTKISKMEKKRRFE